MRLVFLFRLVCAAFLAAAGLAPVHAGQNASHWSQGLRSSVRLIAGKPAPDGSWRAGVEIRLAPGTVTYWRNPGDSGVPPVFTFSDSQNLREAEAFFPAPAKIEEGGAEIYGYKDKVIFPVRVQPADAARPVDLVLSLDYAVCEKICIPARAEARLLLEPGGEEAGAAAIEAAMARVPALREAGAEGPLAILSAEAAGRDRDGNPAYRIIARAPKEAGGADLFAETAMGYYIETGRAERLADGRIAFPAIMVERPKDAAGQAVAIFTLAAGDKAVETRLTLDLPGPLP